MKTDLIFKRCTIEDLDILVEISRTTFIDAFEKDNDPKDFKTYIDKAFNKQQITSELLHVNSLFYFMMLEDVGLVGYVKLNRKDGQKEQFDFDAIELERIYVLKKFQGKKLGQEALEIVVDIAKTQKASCLWLGVWEKNTRAIAFYERHGFIRFDSHTFYMGADLQTDILFRLDFI